MSYLGAGLYDDDVGADVRARYRELVADGASGEEATDALLAEWGDVVDDEDEGCPFWLALADTQARVGRLEDRVRERAMALIESGADLARFGHDRRLHARRRKVLGKLAERLMAPPRSPARLRKPFRSTSPVAVGDVFWFTFPSGRRVLLRCVAVHGDERDSYPTVEVLDGDGEAQPSDAAMLVARVARAHAHGRWPDLLSLVRYRGDPDPSDQIEVVARSTAITRRHTVPSLMRPWTKLEDDLARIFGT